MANKTLIAIVVALVIIAVGLWYYFTYYLVPTKPGLPEPALELTGLEVAQRTALFLDKTIKSEGDFELYYGCVPEAETCTPEPYIDPPHSGQIILAYKELFQKTQNITYKEKADRAMEVIFQKCQENRDICEWNFFPLFVYYKESGDQKYLEAMLSVKDKFLAEKPRIQYVIQNNGSKFAILYQATGDSQYLERLTALADSFLQDPYSPSSERELYRINDFIVANQTFRLVWDVFLPAFRLTNNPAYLQAAKDIMGRADPVGNFEKIADSGLAAFQTILALENLLNLAQLDQDQVKAKEYSEKARQLAESALQTFWDIPENKKFAGDNGFLENYAPYQLSAFKSTLNNGWFARLFLRMENEVFRIETQK